MPRPPKAAPRDPRLPSSTLIIDNGAYTMKAGFAPAEPTPDQAALSNCHSIPNALARTRDKRTFVASQLDTNISQWNDTIFRRPVERGQLVSWEAQKEIWDHSFFDETSAKRDLLVKQPQDTTLILTEAPNTMPFLQKNADEIIMEEWGFGGYARVVGSSLDAYNDLHAVFGDTVDSTPNPDAPPLPSECLLVVDSGYSHTTITPLYNGQPLERAIRRLDFGGKHLTNFLKEIISLRYFDLHQDFKVVNDIKEDVCFVSQDFKADLEKTWKGNIGRQKAAAAARNRPITPPSPSQEHADKMDIDHNTEPESDPSPITSPSLYVDYILPDGLHIKRGFSRPYVPAATQSNKNKNKRKLHAHSPSPTSSTTDPEVSMTLGNERFSVPEILFSPSDIGNRQPGLGQAVMQSLAVLPPGLQACLLANILVVGGNAKIPGFVERLQSEVRSLTPVEYVVRVRKMDNPVTSTWLGGARMAWNRDVVRKIGVSREEYFEHGSAWVARRFATGGAAVPDGGGK